MAARTKKTSTRRGASSKSKSTAKGKTDAEKRAEEKQAQAKADKAKREAEAKAKEKAHAAAEKIVEKAKARQDLIDSGALIEGEGDTEFHIVERDEPNTVEVRAGKVIDALKASKVPVVGRELMDEFGGGWPQYLSFFSMLKHQGLVREYRKRTGERGGSGVAYLWIG